MSHITEVSTLRLDPTGTTLRVFGDCAEVAGDRSHSENLVRSVDLSCYTQVHYRIDPPVDAHYTDPLKLLVLAQLPVVNSAATLLGQSEKLIAHSQAGLAPPSVVVSTPGALKQARAKLPLRGKSLVLKPLFTAQSIGVQRLEPGAVEPDFNQPMLAQIFLPQITREGELRTWWADGQCVGALWKHPLQGDFRVLVDQGSALKLAPKIPPRIQAKFPAVRRLLKTHGIRLAAVDWIGAQISDFNFTSPGLLVQLQELARVPIAQRVISRLANRA